MQFARFMSQNLVTNYGIVIYGSSTSFMEQAPGGGSWLTQPKKTIKTVFLNTWGRSHKQYDQ